MVTIASLAVAFLAPAAMRAIVAPLAIACAIGLVPHCWGVV
jgi:hypothetical protein